MSVDLAISATLNGINLDNAAAGYELHIETRGTIQQQWRKQTVSNAYVEGEYDVLAVRSNVTEAVSVWVYGNDASDFTKKVLFLESAIAQPSFSIVWVTGPLTETWNCTYSEYTLETNQSFQIATLGIMHMQIVRRPSVSRVFADNSTSTA